MTETAILNGFGRSLGDGIVGLQALCLAIDRDAVTDPVLYRLPGLSPMIQSLYVAASGFMRVADLPWDAAAPTVPFSVPGRVIDLRDYAFDPTFRGAAMIDWFARRLGVDPSVVPAAARRNTWLAPRLSAPAWDPGGPVLLCAEASMPLRSMPIGVADAIERGCLARGVSVTRLRRVDTIAALAAQVRAARLVVSTDTAMVHLADAMAVRCLAFFPTHDPAWRVRDYPRCRAVRLDPGLPGALEFARDAADVTAAHAAWFRPTLDWLNAVLDEELE